MNDVPSLRFVLIGDSITEWGRPRAGTPGYDTALGHGYVARVAVGLREQWPGQPVEVLNRGVGGHTVRDLAARWDEDVLQLRPDWLSVMIGINDVWRFFDPARRAEAVPPEEYAQTLDLLISLARPVVKQVVILTPFYAEPDRADPMRRRMDEFGAIAARVAERHHTRFVDVQAVIDELLRTRRPEDVAHDKVHVGEAGHAAIAAALLQAVGGR